MNTTIRRLQAMVRGAAWLAAMLAGGASALVAQNSSGTAGPRPHPLLWANIGLGTSTAGFFPHAGVGLSQDGWAIELKALGTFQSTANRSWKSSGNRALMVGRTVGGRQRSRIVAGPILSTIRREKYGRLGWLGDVETIEENREIGLAATLATRTRPALLFAAGIELTGFVTPNSSFLGASVVLSLGN